MITLDAIRCFCAVVDLGSFRRAAEATHRSQPAVTQQIKRLETVLGHVLLDRKTGTLTVQGQVVYERGARLIQGAESLRLEVDDLDETGARELSVGTSDTNALYFLPPHANAFSKAMPEARLVVECGPSDAIADAVARGDLDLGIVTLPLDRDDLETRTLFDQRLVLAVPKSHAIARQRRTTLSRLRDEPFVLIHRTTRTGAQLDEYFSRHAFTPQAVMHSGSFEVIKQYVAAGVGLSFLPEMVLQAHDLDSIAILGVPGLPRVGIGVVWRAEAYQTKLARAFLKQISSGLPSRRGTSPDSSPDSYCDGG